MQKENSAKQQDVHFWLRQTYMYIQYIEDSVYIMYLFIELTLLICYAQQCNILLSCQGLRSPSPPLHDHLWQITMVTLWRF